MNDDELEVMNDERLILTPHPEQEIATLTFQDGKLFDVYTPQNINHTYKEALQVITTQAARITELETVLADMEHAVNRSVSGMSVDIGEWLRVIHEARKLLGDKVKG
jgi:hypothetical protein